MSVQRNKESAKVDYLEGFLKTIKEQEHKNPFDLVAKDSL
jgi:hypothetical protein